MLAFANLQFRGVHGVAKNYCNVVYIMGKYKKKENRHITVISEGWKR